MLSYELPGQWIWICFLVAATLQALFYLVVFRRFAFRKADAAAASVQPVSVIICARNEVRNLEAYLPLWLDQDHPDYEVILVNDCSWDDTEEFLKTFAVGQSRLKVVTIKEQERYSHGKKFALTLGIKAAKNDWLLFTDADCRPASRQWISSMQSRFQPANEIVLGYGAYEKQPGLINRLIRLDAAMIAMQYFSFALAGNSYMGVGRNLAYRKTLFFRNKGFAKHNHLLSGDDDLLVNETATATNVAIQVAPESFTYSLPKTTFSAWFRQKSRHMTTSGLYKFNHRLLLGTLAASSWLFYATLITLLVLSFHLKEVLAVFGVLLALKMTVFGRTAVRLKEKDLIVLFPIFEVMLVILQPIFFIGQFFSKKRTWR